MRREKKILKFQDIINEVDAELRTNLAWVTNPANRDSYRLSKLTELHIKDLEARLSIMRGVQTKNARLLKKLNSIRDYTIKHPDGTGLYEHVVSVVGGIVLAEDLL